MATVLQVAAVMIFIHDGFQITVFPAPFCPVMSVRGFPNSITALSASVAPKLRIPTSCMKAQLPRAAAIYMDET